jgi:RNA polymerase sigma-B factor
MRHRRHRHLDRLVRDRRDPERHDDSDGPGGDGLDRDRLDPDALTDQPTDALFRAYRRDRQRAVRNELVERFVDVASTHAHRYAGRGEDVDDLRQVALVGLIRAIERFDPDRGIAFRSFAKPTIEGEVKRHFRDRTWRVAVPRRLKDRRTGVLGAVEHLRHRCEREPTPDEVASYLGVERDVVLDTLAANRAYRVDGLAHGDDADLDSGPTARSIARSISASASPSVDDDDDRIATIVAVRQLGERSRRIVYWRFYEGCTQSEIGERLGIGQVHVSRLLRRALAELRERCAGLGPSAVHEQVA